MNHKILIIDDNAQDRKVMEVLLEKEGYSGLLFAETAEQGQVLAVRHSPEVILIDVVLDKGVDGFDVCMQLRRQGLKSKIVMITGKMDAINVQKARISGADEILEKVAGYQNLPGTIRSLI